MRLLTKLQKLILTVLLIGSPLLLPGHAHAQSLNLNVNFDWINGSSSCYGTANGQAQAYYGALAGDSVTLHITNVSSYSIDVDVMTGAQTLYTKNNVSSGSSFDTPAFAVNSEILVQDNGSVCSSGHGGPGDYAIEAASGTMSCSIQNNQVWNVSLNYSNIITTATLYRGSSYVYQFATPKQSIINTSLQFSAQSSPATYYLYYSADSSGRLLGQATCPATTAVTNSSSSSSSKSTTPASSTSKPTPAATSTNQPATTSQNSPGKVNSSQIQNSQNKLATKPHKIPTWIYSVVLLALGSLGFAAWKLGWIAKSKNLLNKRRRVIPESSEVTNNDPTNPSPKT